MSEEKPTFLRIWWIRLALTACACLAIVSLMPYDIPLAIMFEDRPQWLHTILKILTEFGKAEFYLIPAGIMAAYGFWKSMQMAEGSKFFNAWRQIAWQGLYVFTSTAMSGLGVHLFKAIFGRARPRMIDDGVIGFHWFQIGSDYASFPSGHTMTVFAVALAMSMFFPKWKTAFLAFALLVASTRVLLTAHFLTDVLAGVLLAYWITKLITILFKKYTPLNIL